jgi:hypothetical protein
MELNGRPDFADFADAMEEAAATGKPAEAARAVHRLGKDLFGSSNTESRHPPSPGEPLVTNQSGFVFPLSYPTDETRPQLPGASIVPMVLPTDLAFVRTVLKTAVLYSPFSALVVPDSVRVDQLNGQAEVRETEGLDRVVALNREFDQLVRRGSCAFLPARSQRLERDFSYLDSPSRAVHQFDSQVEAPMLQSPQQLAFNPLNPASRRSPLAVGDALVVYKQVVLPCFPGADLDLIARIAADESEAFHRFSRWLGRAAARMSAVDSAPELIHVLDELDHEVAQVDKEARRVGTLKALRNVDLAAFTVSLAVAIEAPGASQGLVAGLIGSASFLDLVRKAVEQSAAREDLRRSTFYLPWRIEQATRAGRREDGL